MPDTKIADHLAKLPTANLEEWLDKSGPHFPELVPFIQEELDSRKG